MCKSHNKVFGKEAVVLFAEARLLNNTCQARFNYLKKQAMSFHSWLSEQPWCTDATGICSNLITQTENLLKEQGPSGDSLARPDDELSESLFNTDSGKDDITGRFDDEAKQQDAYWGMCHNLAYKAERIAKKETSQELFEAVQAFIDKIEPYVCVDEFNKTHPRTRQLLAKTRAKVNFHHFKLHNLEYKHWTYLMNWLNALMGIEKQYNNEEQGITANYDANDLEAFGLPEELHEDVRLAWYSRD